MSSKAYDPRKGDIKSLRFILRYIKPYRAAAALAFVALFFTSFAVLAFGKGLQYLVDEGLGKGNPQLLDNAFMILLGVTALLSLATYTRFYMVSWVGEKVVADIRNDIYRHVIRLDVAFFETTRTGELLSRITTDTTLLQTVVGSSVSIVLRNTLMLLGGTTMLFVTSAKLASYVFLVLPLVVGPIVVLGRRVRGLSRATQSRVADIAAHAEETISGIRSIQALSLEQHESSRFGHFVHEAYSMATQRIRTRAGLTALVIALVFGAIVTVLWVGGRDVLSGALTTGELSSFVFYSVVVAAAVGGISEVLGELQRSAGAAERLVELRHTVPQIVAPVSTKELPAKLRGEICFEDVSFAYPAAPDKRVLHHFNLQVAPGETVALVGPSGAGKTTVFQLLLRFYDPELGRIMVDGIDVRDVQPTGLRAHIGLVPQDPLIFSANAWENIRAGKPAASDEEVIEAASLSASLEFLEKLPEGFNTYLGEKGVRLSGGQRQRIAIARAMVRNPRLLLLDEATSALDSENELLVQQAIDKLKTGRTTIVIAHRLATVLKANRIIVMHNGSIEATGTHKELLEKSPLYARLAALQFSAV